MSTTAAPESKPLIFARHLVAFALVALSSPAFAVGDYASCLLDKLPGIQSGAAFSSALALCGKEFPDRYYSIERGSGRGLLGYKSPEACTLDKAKATSWQPAAATIRTACGCLYGEASGRYDMCDRQAIPADLASMYDMSTPEKRFKIETHYRKVFVVHPDGYAIMSSEAFWPWVHSDKDREMTLMYGDWEQVSRLFSAYKADRASSGLGSTPNSPPPPVQKGFRFDASTARPVPN